MGSNVIACFIMKYRSEIDGLRAVSVLAVILYHAGIGVFSGGYVGVDVFFVISGYLITSILLQEREANNFSLARFYERRARRILPALFFVVLCSIPLAYLCMLPDQFESFAESIFSVLTFSSNFFFYLESGYFEPAADLMPLLHTWSLAVEEQFYLFFPLFIFVLGKYGNSKIVLGLILVSILSLIMAQWGGHLKVSAPYIESSLHYTAVPDFAFYLIPTRLYELMIGSLIACYWKKKYFLLQDTKLSNVLGGAGMALILYAIVTFNDFTPIPGIVTLIPVLGATLVIMFALPGTFVCKVLSQPLFVYIGLLSYSAYLWHYPLFVFERLRSMGNSGIEIYLILTLLTFLLSYFSWRFIETQFRNVGVVSKKVFFLSVLLAVVVLFAIALVIKMNSGFDSRWKVPQSVLRTMTLSPNESKYVQPKCGTDSYDLMDSWFCNIGDPDKKPSFLIAGDSHSFTALSAFQQYFKGKEISGRLAGLNACPPILEVYSLARKGRGRDCFEHNKNIFEYVRKNKINKIIMFARWNLYTEGGYGGIANNWLGLSPDSLENKEYSTAALREGLEKTLAMYNDLGVEVLIVRQPPEQTFSPSIIYNKAYADEVNIDSNLSKFSVSIEKHRRLQRKFKAIIEDLEKKYLISIFETENIFCHNAFCPVGNKEYSYYSDDNHLSFIGSRMLVGELIHLPYLP